MEACSSSVSKIFENEGVSTENIPMSWYPMSWYQRCSFNHSINCSNITGIKDVRSISSPDNFRLYEHVCKQCWKELEIIVIRNSHNGYITHLFDTLKQFRDISIEDILDDIWNRDSIESVPSCPICSSDTPSKCFKINIDYTTDVNWEEVSIMLENKEIIKTVSTNIQTYRENIECLIMDLLNHGIHPSVSYFYDQDKTINVWEILKDKSPCIEFLIKEKYKVPITFMGGEFVSSFTSIFKILFPIFKNNPSLFIIFIEECLCDTLKDVRKEFIKLTFTQVFSNDENFSEELASILLDYGVCDDFISTFYANTTMQKFLCHQKDKPSIRQCSPDLIKKIVLSIRHGMVPFNDKFIEGAIGMPLVNFFTLHRISLKCVKKNNININILNEWFKKI